MVPGFLHFHQSVFGGDFAFVRIPSAVFELNFAGLFNFSGLSATTLAAFPAIPGVGAVTGWAVMAAGYAVVGLAVGGVVAAVVTGLRRVVPRRPGR